MLLEFMQAVLEAEMGNGQKGSSLLIVKSAICTNLGEFRTDSIESSHSENAVDGCGEL
jgi:hypothetical protein